MTAGDGANPAAVKPLYTVQAYFKGQMQVSNFARIWEDRTTTTHNVFDETLPVIDIGAIKDGNKQEREAMLEAAKSWGTKHGVPLEVVKQVETNGKDFFAQPMERKVPVRAPDFVFGNTGGSPIKWKSNWW